MFHSFPSNTQVICFSFLKMITFYSSQAGMQDCISNGSSSVNCKVQECSIIGKEQATPAVLFKGTHYDTNHKLLWVCSEEGIALGNFGSLPEDLNTFPPFQTKP